MLKLKSSFTGFLPNFIGKHAPVFFLLASILAFGIFIPQLGIYQDDWVFVYNAYARGPQGLREFLNADGTPFSSILNIALFQVLGLKPIYWHLSALFARWLTVTGFWLLLRELWPRQTMQVFWTCLVFAVHPFFILQPLSYTFLHIWLSYGLLVYSIYWMLLSVDQLRSAWLYGGLALASGVMSILTSEYFAGLELLRPVVLWLFLHDSMGRQRVFRVIKVWLPYFSIFVIYAFWRFFVYEVPIEGRNDPVVLEALLKNPLSGLQMVIANLAPDSVSIVISAWYKLLDPAHLNLTLRRDLLFIILSLLASLGIYLAVKDGKVDSLTDERQNSNWWRGALWLGFSILLLGLIPPYAGGLFIGEKNPLWSSRFGLASMAGAALLLVVFLEVVATNRKTWLILLSILVGFSIGYHARYTNDFRYAWKKEQNLFRQLLTRVPELQGNTAIVAEGEILTYMGDYPTAYAINTIYVQPLADNSRNPDYWFFGITSNFGGAVDDFMGGMELEGHHRSISFTGRSDQSLIIAFEPEMGQCLHVIRPEDAVTRALPPLLRTASWLSALDRIESASPESPFMEEIGIGFPEDWCAYYQKADLARQDKDWDQVIRLWEQALKNGYTPGDYFEYFLFLDAYVHQSRWDEAERLTLEARRLAPTARFALCDYWNSLPSSGERDSAFERLDARLKCSGK